MAKGIKPTFTHKYLFEKYRSEYAQLSDEEFVKILLQLVKEILNMSDLDIVKQVSNLS